MGSTAPPTRGGWRTPNPPARLEDPVGQFPQLALRRGLPGYGARGNEQPGPWELGAEAAEEVERTQDLAHRNRMEPDGAGTGLTK